MDVFVQRLSRTTTQRDLKRAVISMLAKKLHIPFTATTSLDRCKVMSIKDNQGMVENHGLLSITPDSAAKWFIKHSKNRKLHNRRLVSRQYFVRKSHLLALSGEREQESRRPSLIIDYIKEEQPVYLNEGINQFRKDY